MTTGGEMSFTTKRSELTSSGTPLKEFKGRFHSLEPKQEARGGQLRTVANLNFTDMEVIKSDVPYPHPTATLSINYSQRERSSWGLLLQSLDAFKVDDLMLLKGKMVHLVSREYDWSAGRPRRRLQPVRESPGGTEEAEPEEDIKSWIWEVKGIEGQTSGTAPTNAGRSVLDEATDLLNGKTQAEFAQAAFSHPVLRLQSNAIIDGSLVTALVATGKVRLVGDRYEATKVTV